MNNKYQDSLEGIETISLPQFTEKSYLEYSMYVILDRALPHISDGLKPVQRRIVYAMSELSLRSQAKYKKSARTVGDVLGKFHPHGDSACYEAMVLMAQPFSYRYPLIDGQGNWGSMDDPKSFAAMRYTEARLSRYADLLLQELEQGTVDWLPNFDGTLEEPAMLPARVPNLLLNGSTGIAVGMATDIPPHNLREVVCALVHLIENPKATLDDICGLVKGPDYPTEAEIISSSADIKTMYRTGNGSVRMRAVYAKEDDDIVITALPHQVSGAKVMEQIAAQMQAKKLPMVADLRDESDHESPVRLVIEPRSNRIDVESLMNHLFATTDLERTYRVNLNVIGIDGKPRVRNLLEILTEWLQYRTQTVRRRIQFRLERVMNRLHILDGLLIAFLNVDEVIRIIRFEDEPKQKLMERFGLTDIQAEAILELKLRHLAKLEEMKIRGEQSDLAKERDHLQELLSNEKKLKKLIVTELKHDAEQYGDDRCSPIVARAQALAIKEEDILPTENMTVVLSEKGWIRAAKGHEMDPTTLNYKAGDQFSAMALGRSNQSAVFLDSTGRSYSLLIHNLPSARGQGEPLTSHLNPPAGATFVDLMIGDDSYCVLASSAGYGFVIKLEEMLSKNRAGKAILTVPEGASVLKAAKVKDLEKDLVVAATDTGHLLVFPISELPQLAKGKGNKIIQLHTAKAGKTAEQLVAIVTMLKNESLVILSGKRKTVLKPADLKHYMGERGRRGCLLPRGYRKVDGLETM